MRNARDVCCLLSLSPALLLPLHPSFTSLPRRLLQGLSLLTRFIVSRVCCRVVTQLQRISRGWQLEVRTQVGLLRVTHQSNTDPAESQHEHRATLKQMHWDLETSRTRHTTSNPTTAVDLIMQIASRHPITRASASASPCRRARHVIVASSSPQDQQPSTSGRPQSASPPRRIPLGPNGRPLIMGPEGQPVEVSVCACVSCEGIKHTVSCTGNWATAVAPRSRDLATPTSPTQQQRHHNNWREIVRAGMAASSSSSMTYHGFCSALLSHQAHGNTPTLSMLAALLGG